MANGSIQRGTGGAIVALVPDAQIEAYGHSLLNWLRFNHRDLPNGLVYVALCAVLLLAAWGADVAFNHFFVHHYTACGTLGCRPTTGTLPPYHGNPSIPPFKP